MRTFRLPRGPLGWMMLGAAATLGLFVLLWALTAFWVLAVGAGVVGSLAYAWRRLEARWWPGRWRRLPARRGPTRPPY
ncbi:hypothetical protein [Meiothermus granaticius]|nr:hypothetical protein [Meiothermus granaticius]